MNSLKTEEKRTSKEKSEKLDSIIKAYFLTTFATRPAEFGHAFEEHTSAFFERIEFLSNAYSLPKTDRTSQKCAALILSAASLENPKAPAEGAFLMVELLFTGESAVGSVKEKIISALNGYFNPDSLGDSNSFREVFHDAAMAMEARKDVEEQLVLRHSLYSQTSKDHMSSHHWFAHELERLKKIRFRTFAAQIQYGKRLSKNLEQLKEIQNRVSGTVSATETEKKTLSLYRSVSRNMLDMISLADRKAGLLLSANAISLSLIVSFFARGNVDLHPKLYASAVLIAATCALTVLFASLAARPLNRSRNKVSLEEMMKSEGGILHYGNASRLSREDFVKGVKMTLTNEEILEQGLIEEMHFFSTRIVQKFAMVRRAYITMFTGIFLSFLVMILTRFL